MTTRATARAAGARWRSAAAARRRAPTTAAGAHRGHDVNARDLRLRAMTELRSLAAPLPLVAARARRRPWQWLPGVLGLVVATAFACAVVAEATVAGDQAARAVLKRREPGWQHGAGECRRAGIAERGAPRRSAAGEARAHAANQGRTDERGAAERRGRAAGRDRAAWTLARSAPSLEARTVHRALMPDAARRRRDGAARAGRIRRPSPGRGKGAAAFERAARIRSDGGRDSGDPRHRRPAWARPAPGSQRRVQDPELARDAASGEPAELAARTTRVTHAAQPGGSAADRVRVRLQRPVQRARRGAGAGGRRAQPAPGRGRRRGRGAVSVSDPRRLRIAPRARRGCRSPARGGRTDEPVPGVRARPSPRRCRRSRSCSARRSGSGSPRCWRRTPASRLAGCSRTAS